MLAADSARRDPRVPVFRSLPGFGCRRRISAVGHSLELKQEIIGIFAIRRHGTRPPPTRKRSRTSSQAPFCMPQLIENVRDERFCSGPRNWTGGRGGHRVSRDRTPSLRSPRLVALVVVDGISFDTLRRPTSVTTGCEQSTQAKSDVKSCPVGLGTRFSRFNQFGLNLLTRPGLSPRNRDCQFCDIEIGWRLGDFICIEIRF